MLFADVAEQARLLDEKKPGWELEITGPIRMLDTSECILGQLYGNYWGAKDEGIPVQSRAYTEQQAVYAWRFQIKKRLRTRNAALLV